MSIDMAQRLGGGGQASRCERTTCLLMAASRSLPPLAVDPRSDIRGCGDGPSCKTLRAVHNSQCCMPSNGEEEEVPGNGGNMGGASRTIAPLHRLLRGRRRPRPLAGTGPQKSSLPPSCATPCTKPTDKGQQSSCGGLPTRSRPVLALTLP